MSQAPGSRAGTVFGPYLLKRRLGHGGMGEVYEAEHTAKGWTVALKLMSESVSRDPVFRERMKREARITGRLKEPHVVPIHDYGEVDGHLFLEMRLIEGINLDNLLKESGPLTPPRAVAIITQIASALDAAHAEGVMHRDVKPPNILVTRDDFAYLVDFGIASATTDEKLTQMGTAMGTWKYMAPERFSDAPVTDRADTYALACVLYESLTGAPPFPSDNPGALVTAHLMHPTPRPSLQRVGIPKALDGVIARGMAKNPAERHTSAGELARAASGALTTPDRDEATDILRRSKESTLPPPQFGSPPARTPPYARPAAPPRTPPPTPIGRPGWPPAPVHTPAPSPIPQTYQGNSQWGATPPSAPQQFPGPPLWGPGGGPPPRQRRSPWVIVAAAAALVVVLVVVAVAIGMSDDSDTSPQATGTTSPSTSTTTETSTATSSSAAPTSSAAPEAQNRLMGLLPSGYSPGTCAPESKAIPGALVSVKCGLNTDVNGPSVGIFGLYADIQGLQTAFKNFTGTFAIQSCPGNKASPATWWHNSDPNTILGQIACGVYKGAEPQIMWSNQQSLVFGLVAGKPQGPTLDQLYKWWASHS
jgi:serine/threonine protein kinase